MRPIYPRLYLLLLGLFATTSFGMGCDDNIALMPPPVSDAQHAQWLMEIATTQITTQEHLACNPFIPYDDSAAKFDIAGVTSAFPISPMRLETKQVDFIAVELQATHILAFRRNKKNDSSTVDLFEIGGTRKLKRIKTYTLRIDPDESKRHRTSPLPRYLSTIAANAFSIGSSQTRIYFNLDERYEEDGTTTYGTWPPIISSISLARIDHPQGFRDWDYAGSIFPGMYLFSIDQQTRAEAKLDADTAGIPAEIDLRIKTTGACGNINAQGSGFWPLGTTYISFGWGPCLQQIKAEDRQSALYLKGAFRLVLGHRVFLTEHIFTAFEGDILLFNQYFYKSEYAKASEISRNNFSIGWYVADSESLFLKSWDALFDWR